MNGVASGPGTQKQRSFEMSDFDSMRLTKAGNGVRGSVVFTGTVWSELDAYDRLPAQVRAAMRNLKIPISPGEVDQALRSGASVAETLRDLRANDAHLMTFGAHTKGPGR